MGLAAAGIETMTTFDSEKSMPPRLYKYESFNAQSLENLKAQSIYFGPPSGFNDPYDCATSPRIRSLSDNEVEAIRRRYQEDPSVPENIREVFKSTSVDNARKLLMKSGQTVLDEHIAKFLHTRGVSCFSEVQDDLLMWSHYGGKYGGFCLEFDTADVLFEKALPVRYSTEIPEIDLAPLLKRDDFDQVLTLFTTKSSSWSYEREWRVLHANSGTLYAYPDRCLTGVYFGPEMKSAAIEIICLILQGQNSSVKFWRGRRSKSAFKVDFEEFTYTSFLQAKSLGLKR